MKDGRHEVSELQNADMLQHAWTGICSLHAHQPMMQYRCSLGCPSTLTQQPLVAYALACVEYDTIHQTAHAAAVKPLLAEYAAAVIWKDHGPLEWRICCQLRCQHRYSLLRKHGMT